MLNYTTVEGATNKPWMILVHGFTQNHNVFDAQVTFFRDKYKLLLIDLRGHGASLDMPRVYGIEEYKNDIIALITNLDIDKFYYWGTHTGTAVGLIIGLELRDRVLGFILEGTVLPGFEMPRVQELLERAKGLAKTHGVGYAKKDWFEQADWFEYMRLNPDKCRAELHRKIILEFNGEPWISNAIPTTVTNVDSRLDELLMPILIYNGKHDMADFIHVAERIEQVVEGVSRKTISHSGGFPLWENPHEVNNVVERFLIGIS